MWRQAQNNNIAYMRDAVHPHFLPSASFDTFRHTSWHLILVQPTLKAA